MPGSPDGLMGWDRGRNSHFSEYGLIPYQIKGNHAYSIMEANILPADPPPPPPPPADQSQISCPYTHPQPVGRLEGKTTLNVVMFHIKLKGMKFRLT